MQRERVEPMAATMRLSPRPTGQRLSRSALQSGPISVMPRTLTPGVGKALDALPAASLPCLRVIGDIALTSRSIDAALRSPSFAPQWLSEWLSDDIVFLARLFQSLVGAARVLVRLEAIQDDACRRFHTDNVRFRLVTTYRGPGTGWIALAQRERPGGRPGTVSEEYSPARSRSGRRHARRARSNKGSTGALPSLAADCRVGNDAAVPRH